MPIIPKMPIILIIKYEANLH
jgi:hypothetical protein